MEKKMLWLVSGCLATALLLSWLSGHWGARIIAFLGFFVILGFVGYLTGAAMQFTGHPEARNDFPLYAVVLMVCGFVVAWPVSGIPAAYWRAQARRLAQAEAGRFMVHR